MAFTPEFSDEEMERVARTMYSLLELSGPSGITDVSFLNLFPTPRERVMFHATHSAMKQRGYLLEIDQMGPATRMFLSNRYYSDSVESEAPTTVA